MNRLTLATAAAVAALLSFSTLAQAQPPAPAPQQKPRLTMAQAVVIAEFMGQGRALRARLDERASVPVYEVTLKDGEKQPLKVTLAAYGGEVVASERKDGHD